MESIAKWKLTAEVHADNIDGQVVHPEELAKAIAAAMPEGMRVVSVHLSMLNVAEIKGE